MAPKLNTITDAYSGCRDSLERCSFELGVLTLSFKKFFPKEMQPTKALLFESSSPSFRVSWSGYIHDFVCLYMADLTPSIEFMITFSKSVFYIDLYKLCGMLMMRMGL